MSILSTRTQTTRDQQVITLHLWGTISEGQRPGNPGLARPLARPPPIPTHRPYTNCSSALCLNRRAETRLVPVPTCSTMDNQQ